MIRSIASANAPATRRTPLDQAADELMAVARKADNIYTCHIDPKPVQDYVRGIQDRELLVALHQRFQESLDREMQATLRAGSMAGACCNQMRMKTTIVDALAAATR